MTDVTLDFISRQLDRVLIRLGALEDQMTVLTSIVLRQERAASGLNDVIAGLAQSQSRTNTRLRDLEELK